jgi:putative ABC transport system ATP-binding protein
MTLSSTLVSPVLPTAQGPTPILLAKGIGKTVIDSSGELHILDGVDLQVDKGESVALVGASGSGKSTLLSILAGLDTPSTGRLELAGRDMLAMNEDQRAAHRAAHVGFVFQNFQLISHLTALENVMLPLELKGDKQARQKAQAMLERVGLGQRLQHRPTVMSGGEQQRVALARAFVMQPDILMADEPTGSLDHATGEAIIALMFELNQAFGTALLLVTHDMALARRCQRVVQIAAGHLSPA